MTLREVTVLPPGTAPDLSGSEQEALGRLGGATWWVVPGADRSRCRVVTTLLHGNEPSGFRAFRHWVAGGATPAVDVAICLCSVEAALGPPLFAHRALPGVRDANRCFAAPLDDDAGRRAGRLLELIERFRPEAVVDLHNNTGHSPAYGVGPRADTFHLGLTSLFADRFMHTDIQLGTLVEATEHIAPSIVIECGRAGDPLADATALAGLERFLLMDRLEDASARAAGVEVLQHPLRVVLAPWASLAFGDAPQGDVSVTIRRDVDRHNFSPMRAGETLGWISRDEPWPFEALGAAGDDRSRDLLALEGREVRTRREIVPVMMTTSPDIAKSDCLFYALERAGDRPSDRTAGRMPPHASEADDD
jgi:hypothetical protein